MLSQQEGEIKGVVEAIGGSLCVPQMDCVRIRAYVGRHFLVEGAEVLGRTAREGGRRRYRLEVICNLESKLT